MRSDGASRRARRVLAVGALSCSLALALACVSFERFSPAREEADVALVDGFENPPASARPRVWWHWMNGNVTEAGIRADLDWMARVGLGGMQSFDAALATPQIVDERLVYMTPEWKRAFRLAARLADERGLELATAASPGWSETGGPWVPPADGMKKLVWSTLEIEGGRPFDGALPAAPATTGPFQDVALEELMFGGAHEPASFSEDIVVLAHPIAPESGLPRPRLSVAGESIDAELLSDGRFAESVALPGSAPTARPSAGYAPTSADPIHVDVEFDRPQTVRALTLHLPGAARQVVGASYSARLQAAGVDETWQHVADVPLAEVPTTVGFSARRARRFRLVIEPTQGGAAAQAMRDFAPGVDAQAMISVFGGGTSNTEKIVAAMMRGQQISELALHAEPRVHAFELKAGFGMARDYYALDQFASDETRIRDEAGIPSVGPDAIVDLSDRVTPDGRLQWTPPPGRWRVVRLGYSLTGKTNHPATSEATGLEVDKFDGRAVRAYLETYLEMYRDATGEGLIGERGLRAILTDSIEVGASNWTPRMLEHFERRRGYDARPWLLALTGAVVGTREQTDAFLYDYRRTLAELLVKEHYETVAAVAHENGLRYYSEALEAMRATLGDDMSMRAPADVPMSAIWITSTGEPQDVHVADMLGAASVAHVYGREAVAAEALTSSLRPWASSPATLRPFIDAAFAYGVNLPVIHTSVHQPTEAEQPGLALLIFGQYFNRHETWAELARPWVDYMARSGFLLQQGRHVADVAYFYGEEAPIVALYAEGLPEDAPSHNAYDFVSADVVLDALDVEDGELVTPGGARYRLLHLGGSSRVMTVAMLRKLAELVDRGAKIAGSPPEHSPSLADDPDEFAAWVARLWPSRPAADADRVIRAAHADAALAAIGVDPDFVHSGADVEAPILFQHRHLGEQGEVYFLANRARTRVEGTARFRVTGRVPELWRADTSERRPLSYRVAGDETLVDLPMDARDAFFVVFRDRSEAQMASYPIPERQPIADVGAVGWDVDFPVNRGAPERVRLEALAPLDEHPDPGVRHFSGIATYRTTFELPEGTRPDAALELDLGEVRELAEVLVNGRSAGIVWRTPHRVDVGGLVRSGTNALEVRVANLWVNRLIGDVQPGVGEDDRITWTSTPIYRPDAPLRRSGLIGPVRLLSRR